MAGRPLYFETLRGMFMCVQIQVQPGVKLREALTKRLRLREISIDSCIVRHYHARLYRSVDF